MLTTVKYVILLLFLLTHLIILYEFLPHQVFAESPSFVRQIITDPQNDWFVVKTSENSTFVNATDNSNVPIEIGKNAAECIPKEHLFPDISGVSYFSDGKRLYATLWLYYPFTEPPLNATHWLIPPIKDVPWYRISYGISTGIHSAYDTEGSDYQVRYQWNVYDKTWTKILEEMSPNNEPKVLDQMYNHTDFFHNGKKYVDLTMDLGAITSPDQYSVLFYTLYVFIKDGRMCGLSDISNRVDIPPTQFTISTSPTNVELRPGENKTIELQIKAETNSKSKVFLSTSQTNDIGINLSPSEIFVPSYGLATSRLQIKASDNAEARDYTLPIFANMSIPTESKVRGSGISNDILKNSVSANITENSNLTIRVLPKLTFEERLNSFYNSWFTPITGMYAVISGIVVGILPWILSKIRKKKKKAKKTS